MKNIVHVCLDWLFPKNLHCEICDKELDHDSALCEACYKSLALISGNVCIKCGQVVNEQNKYCDNCIKNNHEFSFECARSRFQYTGSIAKLIKEIKYDNKKYLFPFLSQELTRAFDYYKLDADIIVPVPLHDDKLKIRKYNQAEELCRDLSLSHNIPISTSLIKTKNNVSQTTLSGQERHNNAKGVYDIIDNQKVKGKRVLLVDDIYTTGSTANECCKVLLKKGRAKSVVVLTLAHSKPNKM